MTLPGGDTFRCHSWEARDTAKRLQQGVSYLAPSVNIAEVGKCYFIPTLQSSIYLRHFQQYVVGTEGGKDAGVCLPLPKHTIVS